MPVPARASSAERSLFRGYRFPPAVIAHAVRLYFRFRLSLRDVQDLLAERGLGREPSAMVRYVQRGQGDTWHCDELLLKINGKCSWLWPAVDHDGIVLDIPCHTQPRIGATGA